MTRVAVVGLGAIGGLFAGLLAAGGVDVVGVDVDRAVVESVASGGLRLVFRDGRVVVAWPRVATPSDAAEELRGWADYVLVAVKAYNTASAAETASLLAGKRGYVASIQNGLGNLEVLGRRMAGRVLGGVVAWGATAVAPGVVYVAGAGSVEVGAPLDSGGEARRAAEELAGLLASAGLGGTYVEDIVSRIWVKVAINCAVNPVTALTRRPNGALLEDEGLWGIGVSAALEARRTALAEGVSMPGERELVEQLRKVVEATGDNLSSMLQDVLRCRRTEIEALSGEVWRRAERRGLEAPVNKTLYGLVRALESSEHCRPVDPLELVRAPERVRRILERLSWRA